MTEYRRHFVPGGTYFFTVNLAERSRGLLVAHIALLRRAFAETRREHPFELDAVVILPDHLHAVLTLPPGDADFSVRWRKIKAHFSRGLPRAERCSASRISKGERGIWQRRFWEHAIRDEDDFRRHMDYVHYNPVKHGHCRRVADWPYSTFHRYNASGVYAPDWAEVVGEDVDGEFGE
jgi:putative transposase